MEDITLSVRVEERRNITPDVAHFELRSNTQQPLPRFEAGAHIDLHLSNGMVRQYSLLNDPQHLGHYEIAVLQDANSRGGSAWVHASLNQGDTLTISPPRNHFPLSNAPHSLLMAGGIGITPMLAMARQLHHEQADFDLQVWNRSRDTAAFLAESDGFDFRTHCHWHFDDETDTKRDPAEVLKAAHPETHLYVCGPGGFMDHVIEAAKSFGWSEARIHFEYFGQHLDDPASDGFLLRLDKSDMEVHVAASESVLEALQRIGVDIPYSCEQGVCGTCVCKILEGEPDHRDLYFTEAERAKNDQFTPCCSRAKGDRLVIDL